VNTVHLLENRLQPLVPQVINIRDDSHAHAGHAGARDGGHYYLTIVSEQFEAQSRLARQRAVLRYVADLIPTPVHALSIQALTPEEFKSLSFS
jgi:BolA family transcriptional regulator, general stress-responsive regulator